MTKASLKGSYDASAQTAALTVSVAAGDLKLKGTCSGSTFVKGLSAGGLSVGVEKPGFFIVDYDIPNKAPRFQFMSSANVGGKQLKMTYLHAQSANATVLDTSLVFDPSNKVSVKYNFPNSSAQLKYSYFHGTGGMTFEPAYDLGSKTWNFSVQKSYGDDSVKASYDTSKKIMGLEWSRNSKTSGSFKVSASVGVPSDTMKPKLIAERTLDFEV
eukprot:TRINITY_DN38041_c0_g1_i1.p1 TRINITY_DN38041_c0_g1~~TRINITY_DN38041_c0_g1_i1.p1  ORF type:complete len:214 (+),score=19.37 TRINITY_DN38041_c0_g1_i1:303-944(+)